MDKLFESTPVAIDCHPREDLLAIGFIDGSLSTQSIRLIERTHSRKNVFDQTHQSITRINLKLTEQWHRSHKRAIRRLKFSSQSGDHLVVISKNRGLCQWDVESGKRIRCVRECHQSPPVALHCVTDQVCATGDEDGDIKLWDWRMGSPPCAANFQDTHIDVVNDLTCSSDHKILLAVSGDGTLSSINVKKRAVMVQSEEMHAELLSVAIARNGQKVLCGSGEGGYVELFNWDGFGNLSSRTKTGHQDSVDRLLTIDQSGLVATASADGTIRLLHIGQNSDLGCMGEHREADTNNLSPVEDMAMTKDGRYLVSCGQDDMVRFWDLEEHKSGNSTNGSGEPAMKKKKKGKKKMDMQFFEGLEETKAERSEQENENENEDSDDSD